MSGLGISLNSNLAQVIANIAAMRDGAVMTSIRNGMQLAAYRGLMIAQEMAPHDTGKFSQGFRVEPSGDIGYNITTDNPDLAQMLRTGTGEFGPSGGPITPKTANALVFSKWTNAKTEPNFQGKWAFKSVKGQPANLWENETFNRIVDDSGSILTDIVYDWIDLLKG